MTQDEKDIQEFEEWWVNRPEKWLQYWMLNKPLCKEVWLASRRILREKEGLTLMEELQIENARLSSCDKKKG